LAGILYDSEHSVGRFINPATVRFIGLAPHRIAVERCNPLKHGDQFSIQLGGRCEAFCVLLIFQLLVQIPHSAYSGE